MRLIDNTELNRYELYHKNLCAIAEYILDESKVIIYNTYIPNDLATIIDFPKHFALQLQIECKAQNRSIVAQCPYLNALLKSKKNI